MPKTKGNIQKTNASTKQLTKTISVNRTFFERQRSCDQERRGKQKQGTQLTKSIIDFTRAGLQDHLFTKPDELDLDLDTMY